MNEGGPHTVLLDRDGVIVRNRPGYVTKPDQLELLPGASGAIQRLCRSGRRVLVLTNQSVVGRGLVSDSELAAIHERLLHMVAVDGGAIERIFVCPHPPTDGCACRKPNPGLLFAARDEAGVDLADAIFIGDMPSDVVAAQRAGCRAMTVGAHAIDGVPHAADLAAAVDVLLGVPVPC